MDRRVFLSASFAAVAVPRSALARRLKPYEGPEVTSVIIYKARRKMYLLSGDEIVESFRIELGNSPAGAKRFEGDGKTPEGSYVINRRNPNSEYHLSLGISYPSVRDVAYARAQGKEPGGDIFIHGRAGKNRGKGRDWTAGCIAVADHHIEKIYMMVRDGTFIHIYP